MTRRAKKNGTNKKSPQKKATNQKAKRYIKPTSNLVSVDIKTHKDKHGGHPHIIVDDVDENHVSVGITHDKKKGKNSPNYKLEVNPLGGTEQSYLRRQGTVAPKGEYANPQKGAMSPKDFDKAKNYGERAKRKHIEKRNKKK